MLEINDESQGTYKTVIKLDLNFQCKGQFYVIISRHIYLLKEL